MPLSGGPLTPTNTPVVDNLYVQNPARTFQYQVVGSAIAADRVLTIPLAVGAANFALDSFLNVFTVLQQFNAGIQMATSAMLLDTAAGNGVRIQDGGVETLSLRDSTNNRGLDAVLTAAGAQTFGTSAGGLVLRTVGASNLDIQTNSVTRLSFSGGGGGAATFTQGAAAGGAVALTITPGAHTAIVAEVNTLLASAQTITITGGYATQRFYYISTPTITAAAPLTVATATTFEIQSAPDTAGSAAITAIYAFNIAGGALNINNIAGTNYRALRTGAHQVTLTTATQMTADPSVAAAAFNIITIAQSGGAVTVDSAATVYISGAPTTAAGVTLTNAYALFIDAGTARFDGRIEGGPAVTSLTLAGSVTGGAPLQRDVIIQTGNAANPQTLVTRLTFNSQAAAGSAGITSMEPLTVPNGTAAAPGIRTTTSVNGLYESGGTLIFAVQGVGRITVHRNDIANDGPALEVPAGLTNGGNWGGIGVIGGDFILSGNATAGARIVIQGGVLGVVSGEFQINRRTTITSVAEAGGTTALAITPGAHTAVIAETIAVSHAAQTITITGAYATQRFWNIAQPTVSAASVLAIDRAITFNIDGPPTVASSAQITRSETMRVGGSATTIRNIASTIHFNTVFEAYTVTLNQSTQITSSIGVANIAVGQITINQSGGAVTVDNVASLYVTGPLVAGASVTLTNNYALWVDAGISRFDGNLAFSSGASFVLGTTDNFALTFRTNNVNRVSIATTGQLYPATDAAAAQTAAGIFAGSGVPNNANGNNGDFYLRSDGTQAGNTVIYHKEAGAWVALITT